MVGLFRRHRFKVTEVGAEDVDVQLEAALELERVLGRCWDLVNDIEVGLQLSTQLAEEQLAAVQGGGR